MTALKNGLNIIAGHDLPKLRFYLNSALILLFWKLWHRNTI